MSQKRIQSDYLDLKNNYSDNYSADPKENNQFHWEATIKGPDESPYEGGNFRINIIFP
jgi:ubiquitin-conjugating enzyme E2 D/E